MRVTKPTFQSFMHVYTEDRDILGKNDIIMTSLFIVTIFLIIFGLSASGNRLAEEQMKDMRSSPGLPGAHPGPALQLPSQNFGCDLCLLYAVMGGEVAG